MPFLRLSGKQLHLSRIVLVFHGIVLNSVAKDVARMHGAKACNAEKVGGTRNQRAALEKTEAGG